MAATETITSLFNQTADGRQENRNQDPPKKNVDAHVVPQKTLILIRFPNLIRFQVHEGKE